MAYLALTPKVDQWGGGGEELCKLLSLTVFQVVLC